MAILKIQLLNDSGEILKNYATKGSMRVYEDIVKHAICGTLGVSTDSAIEMGGLPKEAEEHIFKTVDKISEEKPKEVVTLDTLPSSTTKLPKHLETTSHKPYEGGSTKHSRVKYIEGGKDGFVMFKCPSCGNYHFGVHQVGDKVKCHNCGGELTVPKELVLAQYTCPNCNNRTYLFIEKLNEIPEISCRVCKSPIDLYFHEKRGQFLGA